MSARPKLETLLGRLIALTGEGKIDWVLSDQAPASYEYKSSSGERVMIDSRDDDAMGPYDLLVYSSDGVLISEIHWSNESSDLPATQLDERLAELYGLAKDHASGAADLLDKLLKDLPTSDDDILF